MTNIFKDQERFMQACDQTTGTFNRQQYQLYLELIREEFQELLDSDNVKDDFDALLDILVVTTGALHSLGVDPEGGWGEVMGTNFAKIDPVTGKVRKREDGKVLKPEGWIAPDLGKYIKNFDRSEQLSK